MTRSLHSRFLSVGIAGLAVVLTGCTRSGEFQAYSMWNESRLKPMETSPDPSRASSSRELVPGTVARGQLRVDPVMYTGRTEAGGLATRIPFAVTHEVLLRGQERYNIYCAPCHSYNGDGDGLIVKRGFTKPPDYAISRLREAPVGHFYDVITNGYGAMYSYAERVPPNDRWAIAAYIRAIQASRPVVQDTRPEITQPTTARPGTPGSNNRSIPPGTPPVGPSPVAPPGPPAGLSPGATDSAMNGGMGGTMNGNGTGNAANGPGGTSPGTPATGAEGGGTEPGSPFGGGDVAPGPPEVGTPAGP